MKTTTFDQLKSMLKSMSLSIFPRLRNMEKNIDEIKATIPTPEKEIIFTADADGNYTCNVPHAELWEMTTDEIGKNARIIKGDEEYAVRGVSKEKLSASVYLIQIFADLNTVIYDLRYTLPKSLILTYIADRQAGISVITDEYAYSLNDFVPDGSKPSIPILYGKRWQNYAVDFVEYTNTLNTFSLKTMSETSKGGAMVGDGLEVVDGKLRVKPEGIYELIETITLGYEEIKEKPEDWETNKTSYFWMQDKTLAPVTTQDWNSHNRFFKEIEYDEVSTIVRNITPDGTPYDFKKIFLRVYTPPDTEVQTATSVNYSFGNAGIMTVAHLSRTGCYGSVSAWIECGMIMMLSGHADSKWSNMQAKLPAHYRYMHAAKTINEVKIAVPGTPAVNLKRGSIFEIWGVRA